MKFYDEMKTFFNKNNIDEKLISRRLFINPGNALQNPKLKIASHNWSKNTYLAPDGNIYDHIKTTIRSII